MNAAVKLISANEHPELVGLTDKDIQKLERLRKKLRKHEALLRGTIGELCGCGAHVMVRHGNQVFDIAQIELTFERLK